MPEIFYFLGIGTLLDTRENISAAIDNCCENGTDHLAVFVKNGHAVATSNENEKDGQVKFSKKTYFSNKFLVCMYSQKNLYSNIFSKSLLLRPAVI